jgi:hypothetical protein
LGLLRAVCGFTVAIAIILGGSAQGDFGSFLPFGKSANSIHRMAI